MCGSQACSQATLCATVPACRCRPGRNGAAATRYLKRSKTKHSSFLGLRANGRAQQAVLGAARAGVRLHKAHAARARFYRYHSTFSTPRERRRLKRPQAAPSGEGATGTRLKSCWPLAGESSVLAHCPCTPNKLVLKCTNPTRHVLSSGAVRSTTSRARWRMLRSGGLPTCKRRRRKCERSGASPR